MIERLILPMMGVNCYVYYDEVSKRGLLVDPGLAHDSISDFVEEQGLKIEAILLTHGHGDHIMGVEHFRELYNCPVYAHEAEKKILENEELNKSRAIFGTAVEIHNVDYFKSGEILELIGKKIQTIHCPGHSPGGVSYLTDQGLFTGDTLFKLGIGRYDLYGGDYDALKNTIINVLYELPRETQVYPGHGVITTLGYEMDRNPHFRK